MSTRQKNAIALVAVALAFIAYGVWHHSLNSRIAAVTDSLPELARENADLSRRLSLIGEPEPGQAPAGYWQYGAAPSLDTCIVCKGKVSSAADKCPHCGNPQ